MDTSTLVVGVALAGAAAGALYAASRKRNKPQPVDQPLGDPFTPVGGPANVRYHGRDWQILGGSIDAEWACRGTLEDGRTYAPARDPVTGLAGWYLPGGIGSPQGCPYWHLEADGTSTINTRGNPLDAHWGQFISQEFHRRVPINQDATLHITLEMSELRSDEVARYTIGFALRDPQAGAHFLEVVPMQTPGYDKDPRSRYTRFQKEDIRYLYAWELMGDAERGIEPEIQMTWAGDQCTLVIPVCKLARTESWGGRDLSLAGFYVGHEVQGPAYARIRVLDYRMEVEDEDGRRTGV